LTPTANNDPIFGGLGEDDSWKKTWSKKSCDAVPLITYNCQVSKFFSRKKKERKKMKISKRNLTNVKSSVTLNAPETSLKEEMRQQFAKLRANSQIMHN
jgi:hypothetical protein